MNRRLIIDKLPQNKYMLKLQEIILPNKWLRFYYGEDHPRNRIIYIRGIVDRHYIVFRYIPKINKAHKYQVAKIWLFYWHLKEGYLQIQYHPDGWINPFDLVEMYYPTNY